MSKLDYIGRPWVAFDENNKQHRKWFAEFQKNKTWGRIPVRFIVSDDAGDLLSLIKERVNKFYIEREFGQISR